MKTILVTGGTRGLGLAICRKLIASEYLVIATGRKKSDELAALETETHPGQIRFETLELGNLEGFHDFISRVTKEHGNLYGLVNNAAVGNDGVLATMHDSEVRQTIDVNVTGSILLTKYAIRSMLMQGEGRVVNIASIIASTGFNGLSVYAATKSAMIGFTKSLAREIGRAQITVNAVSPGYMETDMTAALNAEQLDSIRRRSPMKRFVTADEVASVVHFLLSSAASGLTGTNLTVDAGSTA